MYANAPDTQTLHYLLYVVHYHSFKCQSLPSVEIGIIQMLNKVMFIATYFLFKKQMKQELQILL